MNNSPLGKLTQSDFIRGAFAAVAAGVVLSVGTVIHGVITTPGFDLLSIDWPVVLRDMVNIAVVGAEGAFTGYITKNLLTDENGAILGRWGGVK